MSSGSTAQDLSWKSREQAEEARYVKEKEASQLSRIREQIGQQDSEPASSNKKASEEHTDGSAAKVYSERDFEGGFGGQEDLEDRYATTSGEH